MNPGIRGLTTQFAKMPKGLLGAPRPFPMPDQPWHPEAIDWATRVAANRGVVSQQTIRAVSAFCVDIDTLGIRDRFARFNPFAGGNLLGALVPLYRSFSFGGTVIGNATDTNVNFVNADFTETGATAGLQGNAAGKYLNTGIPGNAIATKNIHLGVGVATTSTLSGYRSALGVFDGGVGMVSVSLSGSSDRRTALFGSWITLTSQAGNILNTGAISQTGDLVAAYPSFYRNGVVEGVSASTSTTYGSSNPIFVFGLSNGASNLTDSVNVRLSWYSIGVTMTAVQVAAYIAAIANLRAALGRA